MSEYNDVDLSKLIEDRGGNVHDFPSNTNFDLIKPVKYEDMLKDKPIPLEYVMTPWFPVQGIAFVYAATGVGKTLFTLNVAYAIAQGGNFLKYKCPMPRKVLYVDGEMAYSQIHSRFIDIVKQQGELTFKDNFYLLTPDKVKPHRLPRISDPIGQKFYSDFIKKEEIKVVVFDNLSVLSSIDENNSEDWKGIQEWLIGLRSDGINVIVVHHAGKDKNGYRGSSKMLDMIDTAISLQELVQDNLETEYFNERKFKIVYQKSRSFGGIEAMPFEITLTPNGWKHQSMEQTNIHMVAERLNIGMQQKEIALELGVSRPYICKLAKKARSSGLVTINE